jgi:bacteriocin-like protein
MENLSNFEELNFEELKNISGGDNLTRKFFSIIGELWGGYSKLYQNSYDNGYRGPVAG